MNINVLLLHIVKSNLDEAIKSNLTTILDKATNDSYTVERLEEKIRGIENVLITEDISTNQRMVFDEVLKILKVLLHGDKPKERINTI